MASNGNAIRLPDVDAYQQTARRRTGGWWGRLWRIVIITGIFCLAGLAYAFLTTPIYQAHAVVQVARGTSGAQGGSAPTDDTTGRVAGVVAAMAAPTVVGAVVDELDLVVHATPHRVPVVGGFIARQFDRRHPKAVARPWFGMNRYGWGGARLDIRQLDVPGYLFGKSLTLVVGAQHAFALYDDEGHLRLRGTAGAPAAGRGVTIDVAGLEANPGTEFTVVRQTRAAAIAAVQAHLSTRVADARAGEVDVYYRDTDPVRAVAVLDRLVQAYARDDARVLQQAAVDVAQPVEPPRKLIVIGGTLFGFLLSLEWVLVRHLRERRRDVDAPAAIESAGLPVFAAVPRSRRQRDAKRHRSWLHRRGGKDLHVLAVDQPADLAVEAIRSLRTRLHFAMLAAGNNILMVSDAHPHAGTTFIAVNLAVVAAQAGERVLLIDGDLREGRLHRIMGHAGCGLSAVLDGRARLRDAVQHTPLENLDFIARGRAARRPALLLRQVNITAALEALSTHYDFIVIAAPTILAAPDAALIGKHAGTRLLVARLDERSLPTLERARRRFAQHQITIHGAVLNAVEARAAAHYSFDDPAQTTSAPVIGA